MWSCLCKGGRVRVAGWSHPLEMAKGAAGRRSKTQARRLVRAGVGMRTAGQAPGKWVRGAACGLLGD